MATILSANRSSVLINGKAIEGLQEIAFQTIKPHQDIAAIGSEERVGVVYGMTRVTGTLRVRSANDELEKLNQSKETFNILASLKHVTADGEVAKEIALDDCQLHGKSFGLAAGGVVEVVYQFSAVRER
jgi:hypothetical protein